MEILGIDEFAKEKREDRSWRGVKEFYLQKVEEMKVLSDRKENVTNIDKLDFLAIQFWLLRAALHPRSGG